METLKTQFIEFFVTPLGVKYLLFLRKRVVFKILSNFFFLNGYL